ARSVALPRATVVPGCLVDVEGRMRSWIIRLVPLVVLAACTDRPNEPSRASGGLEPAAARGGMQGGNAKSSLELIEDDVAAGALDKQKANVYREEALSDPTK